MPKAPYKSTVTLEDALRMSGPRSFNVMIKPAGSLCNLDCNYCYYLDKTEIYTGREPMMSLEQLERFVKTYIEANEGGEVTFNWHGGETLVRGLDFYKKAVEFERKYASGKLVRNTIQTNGTLVNEDFARFFKDNDFLVGVSIDGPEDIHDRFRRDKGGAPTFGKVIRGIEILYNAGVEYNIMSAVSSAGEGRGLEVYRFLKSLGSHFIQFMPVAEKVKYPFAGSRRPRIVPPDEEGAETAPWSIKSIAFGEFMCDIFDYWVRNDVGKYFVNIFDCTLANWCGLPPGTCVYAETCGGNSVVEHNGDLYSCDHFVYPQYRLGNIFETAIGELMDSARQTRFGIDKRNGLPRKCVRCKWFFACHGECPKHRFNTTEDGEAGLNFLCEGYSRFYSHVAPYMDKMRELLSAQRPPAAIMSLLKQDFPQNQVNFSESEAEHR